MLKEIRLEDVPKSGVFRNKKNNSAEKDIAAFLESGMEAAEVTGIERYKTPDSAYSSYLAKAKMLGVWPRVRPVLRGGRVFIIRDGDDDA